MRADSLPPLKAPTIVCVQAGNVNTGAFDPFPEICERAHAVSGWVHVDGAFGLWATTAPIAAHLTTGLVNADSWATDFHKWLNVPYDAGVIICKDPKNLHEALSVSAAYLPDEVEPDPFFYTPEIP